MKKALLLLLILTALHTVRAQIQPAPPLSADTALARLKNNFPQEKVFVQSDRSYYFPGETIWMKAWCTLDGAPSYLSRVLYIELVNAKGMVVLKKMYQLDSLGSTAADMDMPEDIKSGQYSLNAYTLWMLNFPGFIFHKDIYIYNAADYEKNDAQGKPHISMQFFPEGGDIIAGVTNRVAFRITDIDGLPVALKGVIADNTGKKMVDFSTEHDGMGVVEFATEPGKSYVANITTTSGTLTNFRLPAQKEEGVGLRVENTNPNRLFVMISRAEKNKQQYSKLKIVAQMHHQLAFKADLDIDAGETTVPIAKKNLPPGILQVTIFDGNNMPLAERIAFIENYELTEPVVHIDTLNKKPRGGNQISFSVDGRLPFSLSCLVVSDLLDTATNRDENIVSSLLMTSDLKGYIHQPGYYFHDKSPATLHHLDLLLMTQGWRRFEWKRILQNQYATIKYPVESTMSYRGTVTKSDRKELVTDGYVSFIIKGDDSSSVMAEATLTDKGEFLLDDVNFKKAASVAYMGTNKKKADYIVDVHLNPTYIDSLNQSARTPQVNLDTVDQNNRRNSLAAYYIYGRLASDSSTFKNAKLLQGVTVTAKKVSREDSLNKAYAGGPFLMGKAIDPSGYAYARTIWQVIQQTVPGITVEGNPFDPSVSFNRFAGLGSGDATTSVGSDDGTMSTDIVMQSNGIAYYLNEVNVSKDVINTLAVEDVALIKVLKNEGAVLGASQGVIAFYTKQGVVVGKTPYDKAYTVEKKQGYAIVRRFFSPDYAANPGIKEIDNRNTLYWNGNMHPARDGKYRFRFYNNDKGKQFRLLVQGIDKDGHLVYVERIIH